MNISSSLDKLKSTDIYSLILFILYKLKDSEKYSTLSELAYLLDKDSLLRLCQYYGGLTITIPKIRDLEKVLDGLLLFQEVDLEHKDFDETISKFDMKKSEKESLISTYIEIKKTIENYRFNI